MAGKSDRLARIEPAPAGRVSLDEIDAQLDALIAANPCMANHHAPPHLDDEAELRWIDAMLSHHEKHGPCDPRSGPDWRKE